MARSIGQTLALAAAFVACTLGGLPRAWAADPPEPQVAQALFDEARALMDRKRFSEACPKLAESQRLDPGGGTLLNLALCYEKEGKLATARATYEESLAVATHDKRKDRQSLARERMAALDATVPRLRVVVSLSSDMEGLEVKLDGMVLRRPAWGVATPIDPGSHVVEVTGPSRTPWSTSFVMDPSQHRTVDVPALAPLSALPLGAPVAAAPAEPVSEGSAAPAPAPPPDVVYYERRANPVFYTALGLMLAAAGTSGVTGVMALVAQSNAKDGCLPDRSYCRDQTSADAADRAHTLAWVSTISMGVAIASFVTVLAVPSRMASRTNVGAAPLPGGGAALGVGGSF